QAQSRPAKSTALPTWRERGRRRRQSTPRARRRRLRSFLRRDAAPGAVSPDFRQVESFLSIHPAIRAGSAEGFSGIDLAPSGRPLVRAERTEDINGYHAYLRRP